MVTDKMNTAPPAEVATSEVPFSELAKRERKPVRRRGRPPKSTRRKHVTFHLTNAELEELGTLHAVVDRFFSVSRSELIGVAVSLLSAVVERGRAANTMTSSDLEGFRSWTLAHADFTDLRNPKISRGRRGVIRKGENEALMSAE